MNEPNAADKPTPKALLISGRGWAARPTPDSVGRRSPYPKRIVDPAGNLRFMPSRPHACGSGYQVDGADPDTRLSIRQTGQGFLQGTGRRLQVLFFFWPQGDLDMLDDTCPTDHRRNAETHLP